MIEKGNVIITQAHVIGVDRQDRGSGLVLRVEHSAGQERVTIFGAYNKDMSSDPKLDHDVLEEILQKTVKPNFEDLRNEEEELAEKGKVRLYKDKSEEEVNQIINDRIEELETAWKQLRLRQVTNNPQ